MAEVKNSSGFVLEHYKEIRGKEATPFSLPPTPTGEQCYNPTIVLD